MCVGSTFPFYNLFALQNDLKWSPLDFPFCVAAISYIRAFPFSVTYWSEIINKTQLLLCSSRFHRPPSISISISVTIPCSIAVLLPVLFLCNYISSCVCSICVSACGISDFNTRLITIPGIKITLEILRNFTLICWSLRVRVTFAELKLKNAHSFTPQ